ALMFRENVILYPVNPQQFASYRKSYSNAGCKDDVTDAILLARMLRERISFLKAWEPDDENTRMLARLCEVRRKLASRWIRILFVVWKTRTPYDPQKYLITIHARNPPPSYAS
ncbi:MAG: transposase, partial [Fuerstiella sp.]